MKLNYNIVLIILASVLILEMSFVFTGCSDDPIVTTTTVWNPSPQAYTHDASSAAVWIDLMCNSVAAQDIPPPRAARIYGYGAVTMYECVMYGMPNNRTLSGQLNEMPAMPEASLTDLYDWPAVIAGAMPVLMRGMFDTIENVTNTRINNLRSLQEQQRRTAVGDVIVDRSLAYGESVANKVIEWARTDKYIETRTMTYAIPPRTLNPANWAPTDPAHGVPLEPYWKLIRSFAMTSANSCDVPNPYPFDSTGGGFYNDALEVKTVRENLTAEQKNIALYWQDKLRTGTPAGHWLAIMNVVAGIKQLNLQQAVEMYALGCMAMHDAFISCWESKFRYNFLRPQTFIRDYIPGGENWSSFLACPVFPSFTSGHSTQSSSVAYILTDMFGDVPFTDTAVVSLGFQPRSFTTFFQARDEATVSRLYGGIHYRFDNEKGREQGIKVAQNLLSRVHLRN